MTFRWYVNYYSTQTDTAIIEHDKDSFSTSQSLPNTLVVFVLWQLHAWVRSPPGLPFHHPILSHSQTNTETANKLTITNTNQRAVLGDWAKSKRGTRLVSPPFFVGCIFMRARAHALMANLSRNLSDFGRRSISEVALSRRHRQWITLFLLFSPCSCVCCGRECVYVSVLLRFVHANGK